MDNLFKIIFLVCMIIAEVIRFPHRQRNKREMRQKKLADDMQAHGAKVYLQLGSHYPSADYFKLQSAWFVDSEGKSGFEDRKAWSITYGDEHWPQYSYVSEEFRRMLEKDFAAYLKPFSTNTNVAGVILHNEPGLFWMGDRIFDYAPPSVEAFRVRVLRITLPNSGCVTSCWWKRTLSAVDRQVGARQ